MDKFEKVPNIEDYGLDRPEYILKNGHARNVYGLLIDIEEMQAEITRLQNELDWFKQAVPYLEKIANPIKSLEEEALSRGDRLNGVAAVSLANDPSFLRGVAERALYLLKLEDPENESSRSIRARTED